MKKNEKVCSICGSKLAQKEGTVFGDKLLCKECFNQETDICADCGKRIWSDSNFGDQNIALCSSCYNRSYTRCADCDDVILLSEAYYHDGSDTPYCDSCYDSHDEDYDEDSDIHSYNYKPEPYFYGKGELYYGVELEIDEGGENSGMAVDIMDISNIEEERIYCKHDGSLCNGFEIVSHPMTLSYHMNDMNWDEIFEEAVNKGYRSHDTDTCGLHVHINRSAFGKTEADQEEVIARIVYFFESNWNELVKFSRRTESTLKQWANRYGIMENVKNTYDKTKESNTGRYVAVNLNNYHTVEIRIFRGTLNGNTFYATLQLVDEICKRAIQMCDESFEKMSWLDFVSYINKEEKPELIRYLKLKRLYVNELVSEEEI